MLTHANLIISALGWLATGEFLTPGGRFLHAAPMFHLADLAAWTAQVVLGGTHVIIPMFEPVAVMKAIERHQITDALLVPTMIQMLVSQRVAERCVEHGVAAGSTAAHPSRPPLCPGR